MSNAEFVKACLKPILGNDSSDDIAEYIVTIDQEDDFNEFMTGIVDRSNDDHVKAFKLLKEVQFGVRDDSVKKDQEKIVEAAHNAYREHFPSIIGEQPNKNKAAIKSNKNGIAKVAGGKNSNLAESVLGISKKAQNADFPTLGHNQTKITQPQVTQKEETKKPKKKLKFVDFYNQDNKSGLKKGRQPCDCEATEHKLINNCTTCGRIVCEQEGSGPCFFCGNMVCSFEEMQLLAENSKESDKLYNFLIERSKSKEWRKAIEARDKLLEFDNSNTRATIYDDETDYYPNYSTSDTDTKQRENERRGFFHRDLKLILDLATRETTVTLSNNDDKTDHLLENVNAYLDCADRKALETMFQKEVLTVGEEVVVEGTGDEEDVEEKMKIRCGNDDLIRSIDKGMCLSMHQPYASLLVAGIKRHEGRTWRTNHRGRLWIAAASKIPEDEDILACEEMYRIIYNDPDIKFPRNYPTKCLLGCVQVENCLSQSEYREKYPDGESDSPYVLICSTPVILPVFYPMSGQHKIFQLPKDIHAKAKAALIAGTWV